MIAQTKRLIRNLTEKNLIVISIICVGLLLTDMWLTDRLHLSLEVTFIILTPLVLIGLGLPLVWVFMKYAAITKETPNHYRLYARIIQWILYLLISGLLICYAMAKYYEIKKTNTLESLHRLPAIK